MDGCGGVVTCISHKVDILSEMISPQCHNATSMIIHDSTFPFLGNDPHY